MFKKLLLNAETAAENEGIIKTVKDFLTELIYGGSEMEYENFSFGNQILTYRMMILAIALGLIIASAIMLYKRKVDGKMVRELWKKGATSPETAKTLGEIGLADSRSIVYSLKRGTLRRMLRCAEKDEHDKKMRELIEKQGAKKAQIREYMGNPHKDRYYIPEERAEEMVALFSSKGSGIGGFLLTVVFAIGAAALLFALVPWFIALIDKSM